MPTRKQAFTAPVDEDERPVSFGVAEAKLGRFLTIQAAAHQRDLDPVELSSALDKAGIQPVGVLRIPGSRLEPALFRASDIDASALRIARRPAHCAPQLTLLTPPVLAGTRTPTAGSPYVWRDPRRAPVRRDPRLPRSA